ncbi:putative Cell division protein FtsQ [Syntrophobacter sp. SbD1]|nr:putative Cell division protein FtsQ [Syntrophobacter sp. SbD1]
MIKPKKMRRNRYQESALRRLKGNFRTFQGFFAVFALFCFLFPLGAGLSRLYYMMINAPWLKLEKIEISGIKKLDRSEVLDVMGLRRGQCSLSINTRQVTESLKQLPAVREVSVRLESHERIMVSIVEREPAAIVRCGDQDMQMDLEGILFSEATADENSPLPLVTGLCDSNRMKGNSLPAGSLEQIRALLAAIDGSKGWLSGTAINECRWTESGFTLILGERKVPVDIGRDAYEQKITKLKKVINTLNEQNLTDLVTRIDLDYRGQAYLEGQFFAPRPAQGSAKQPG